MKDSEKELYEELQCMENKGITLWLGGKRSDPSHITKALCVREDARRGFYMRDYVYDGETLKELRFDRVVNC
ncbi:MAG: hypothetical protein K6E13_00795 [Lachnospiraceae bacterium]|nr:hypothetical protein [Lachnospiraceae bacterium]